MMNQQGRLRTRVAVFACVSAVALIADQLTKAWAMAALSDGQSIRVIPGLLSLTLVRNPGASLGMGSGATWVISLLAIVAGTRGIGHTHDFHEVDRGTVLCLCRGLGQPD